MARRPRYPYTERTKNGWRASVAIGGKRIKGGLRYGPDGQRRASEDALLILQRREADAAPPPITLRTALDRVLERLEKDEARPATVEFYRYHLGWWIRHLGDDERLDQLTREQVQRDVDDMRHAGTAPQTIRHRLAVLTRACTVCGIEPNPADRKRLSLPRATKRDPATHLAWPEVIEILVKLNDADRRAEMAVLGFVAGTGVRRAEFARMRRTDLDRKNNRIIVPVGKTAPRELPLPQCSAAKSLLEELLELNPPGPFILPGETERKRISYLQGCVASARATVGDDAGRLQLHELRRCFGSRIAEQHPVPIASALLGHALPGVVGRYVHADRKALAQAMADLWADFGGE